MMGLSLADAKSVDSLSALLTIVADPAKHKAMVDELKADIEKSEKLAAEIKEAQAAVAADKVDAHNALAELQARERAHAISVSQHETMSAKLESDIAAMAKRQAELETVAKQLSALSAQRDADHAQREASLNQRETAAQVAAAAIDKRAAALAEKEADYAARISRLKALAG